MKIIKQNPSVTFGMALRKARKDAGFSQKGLADASGLSHMSIRRYETDDRFPELDSYLALAKVLPESSGIAVAWIDTHMEQLFSLLPDDQSTKAIEYAVELGNKITKYNCVRIIEESEPEFLSCISRILELLKSLNTDGRNKAMESIEMISKIPEYKELLLVKEHHDTVHSFSLDGSETIKHNVNTIKVKVPLPNSNKEE